jgi:ferric-dicitrate binding protein FerR (iron transport regulator)
MNRKEEREARDRTLSELVRLAQEATSDTLSPSEQDGLARLRLQIVRQRLLRRARPNSLFWLKAADLAVVIAANVLIITYRHSQPGSDVENASAGNGGHIRHVISDDARIRFADGAEAALEPGARTRVADVYPGGARIVLEDGKAHFCITPMHGAKWVVEAGPYSIQVAGTVFDLAWTESQANLDLSLHAGSITIFGPLFPQGLAMRPGQHLFASAEKVLPVDSRRASEAGGLLGGTGEADAAPGLHDFAGAQQAGGSRHSPTRGVAVP